MTPSFPRSSRRTGTPSSATGSLDARRISDEPVDPPDDFDEEALFEFGTVGEMILAASAYTSFLVGESSVVRVGTRQGRGLGRAIFDRAIATINKPTGVPGRQGRRDEGTGARAVFDSS